MKFDFMGNKQYFLTLSGILFLLSIILLAGKGLNYGIDFKGGNIIHLTFKEPQTEDKIRKAFSEIPNLYFKPNQIIVQAVATGGNKEFIIQYPAPNLETSESADIHSQILAYLKEKLPYDDDSITVSNVGPTIGEEMKKQGIRAAIFAVIGILVYLAWRFEFYSGTAAIAALVHDLILTLGFISFMNFEFDITCLASVLTLLGYSVNDTIVVFDRIREFRRFSKEPSFSNLINDAINSTLSRTINTSLTTLFSLVAILLFGGSTLKAFASILTFGILIGTYSSIFIASPILLYLIGEKHRAKQA